jgi:hypothetical protein
VGGFVLHAYANDDRVAPFILLTVTLEIVRFLGAAAGEILGIEIQHDPLAAEIMQAERFAILRIQRKVRRGRPQRRRLPPGAHGANDKDSNEQKDYSSEDGNHFHLTRSPLVLNGARSKAYYSFWLKKPKPKRN